MASVTGYTKAQLDKFLVGRVATPPVTRSGTKLQINGVDQRFSGPNIYWLGMDDNQGVVLPSHDQIRNIIRGAREMGANFIRSHTIGMSAGLPISFETARGVFNHANLDSADFAVYMAKREGIYLQVALTDMHNYYHGGKGVFVHWAYLANSSGLTDVPYPNNLFNGGQGKDSSTEAQFYGTSSDQLRIRADFKAYISAWLNHVNPYTGVANKDENTLAFIETGNELYDSTAEWQQDIASYIKSIAPNKLVVDGSAATGLYVSNAKGLNAAAIDILGAHYYVYSSDYSAPVGFTAKPSQYGSTTSALDQLAADVTASVNAGKVFMIGEYPWTRSDVASLYAAVEANANIWGDAYWSMIANSYKGVPLVHGGAFGGDDYSIHRPYADDNENNNAPALVKHTWKMSGIPA